MAGGMNGPPVLNGGSNNYDRAVCFDAPLEMDTGLFGQKGKTLKELRDDLMIRLGFAAMLANPPPGMTLLLNSFLQDAQEQLYARYDVMRNERWWAWQIKPGFTLYDVPVDCTKALDLRRISGAYIADNGGRALSTWAPNTQYENGDFVMSTSATGFDYECTAGGGDPSDSVEPAWPTVAGGTVVDAELTWTARPKLQYTWHTLQQGWDPLGFTDYQPGMPWAYDVREFLEVYPAPEKPYVIWLSGQLGIRRFTQDTDYATVDDRPLFLFALANAKAHYRQPDAANYAQMSNRMISEYVAQSHGTRRYIPRVSTAGMKFPYSAEGFCPPWAQPRATWRY